MSSHSGSNTVMSDFWTPARVRWALDRYYDLVACARPPKDPRLPPNRQAREPYDYEAARLVCDIDRALAALEDEDRTAARAIRSVYLDPEPLWRRRSVGERVSLVASEWDCSARTLYRNLTRGIQFMADFLSGRT